MRRSVCVALLALMAMVGCGLAGPTLPPPPSEADAVALVDLLIEKAEERDLEGFCRIAGGGNCEGIAEESGGVAAIPREAPVIAGTRLIPSRPAGEGTLAGGQLVVLCGVDGLGRPYRAETLVSIGPDRVLYAINAVYWSGFDLAVAANTGSPSGGAGINCPEHR
jgi:predicted small lipoprotein YifL